MLQLVLETASGVIRSASTDETQYVLTCTKCDRITLICGKFGTGCWRKSEQRITVDHDIYGISAVKITELCEKADCEHAARKVKRLRYFGALLKKPSLIARRCRNVHWAAIGSDPTIPGEGPIADRLAAVI